jgi:acyl dehydratase
MVVAMKVGDSIELSKQITEDDIRKLIEISGDDNPLHTNEEFAKRTIFKGRIAHGILSAALVSAALTKLFGPGNLWMSQTIKYTFPVRIGDTVAAQLRITSIDKRGVAIVDTKVVNQDGRVVLDGVAECKIMRVRPRSK